MARKLIIYADGGSRGNPGQAAYGALVCEGDKVLIEIAEKIVRHELSSDDKQKALAEKLVDDINLN